MRIDLGQDESSSSCESESGYMTLTVLGSLQGVEVLLGDSPGAEKGQGPMNQSRIPFFHSQCPSITHPAKGRTAKETGAHYRSYVLNARRLSE